MPGKMILKACLGVGALLLMGILAGCPLSQFSPSKEVVEECIYFGCTGARYCLPQETEGEPEITIPGTPESLEYPQGSATGRFTVRWASVEGAAGYSLERSGDGGSTWSEVFSGAATEFAETVGTGSYRYRVRTSGHENNISWLTGSWDCVVEIQQIPAPALQVAEWIKGGPHTLGDGKIYIVEFWVTWCPHCRQAIPHMTELQHTYGSLGVQVVAISTEDAATVRTFVEEQGDAMDYAVAVDDRYATFNAYDSLFNIPGVPNAFLVDNAGNVVWHGHPASPDLTSYLNDLTDTETP